MAYGGGGGSSSALVATCWYSLVARGVVARFGKAAVILWAGVLRCTGGGGRGGCGRVSYTVVCFNCSFPAASEESRGPFGPERRQGPDDYEW